MSPILLISQFPSAPESLESRLANLSCHRFHRNAPESVASALARGVFDYVIFYLAEGEAPNPQAIKYVRQMCPPVVIYVLAASHTDGAAEIATESGANLYLVEPVAEPLLSQLLAKGPAELDARSNSVAMAPTTDAQAPMRPPSELQILRDFSRILGLSLDYKAFSGQFILKLREFISFSRIALFLQEPLAQPILQTSRSNRLECIASLGIPADLIDCFQLNRNAGLGKVVMAQPRILRMDAHGLDPAARKELAILDCEIAVPISDRERVIGVAVLNGSVTGRDYSEDELQLLYLLMEELGLAIRNCWLHMALKRHGKLVGDVLGAISSGALVIDEALNILYANPAVYRFLDLVESKQNQLTFAELPQRLASRVHAAIQHGETVEPFFMAGVKGQTLYRIAILPFGEKEPSATGPRAVMVVAEDYTKIEAGKRDAIKDSREGLIRTMAERFAHEIRNSLVPLTTHAQLLDSRIGEVSFQRSLKESLLGECGRIKRFSEQMLYLSCEAIALDTSIEIEAMLKSAFSRACALSKSEGKLELAESKGTYKVFGNEPALQHAFEELFINALQDGAEEPVVQVDLKPLEGANMLLIGLRDSGPGFSVDIMERVFEPFFTTRNTGVGLGLSVARHIIHAHQGSLILHERHPDVDCDLAVELPLVTA